MLLTRQPISAVYPTCEYPIEPNSGRNFQWSSCSHHKALHKWPRQYGVYFAALLVIRYVDLSFWRNNRLSHSALCHLIPRSCTMLHTCGPSVKNTAAVLKHGQTHAVSLYLNKSLWSIRVLLSLSKIGLLKNCLNDVTDTHQHVGSG